MLEEAGLWKKPQVKVSSLKITSLNFEKIDLNIEIDVTNSNPYPIVAGKLDYSLKIHENEIFSGIQDKSINLESQKTVKVTFPVSIMFNKIFSAVSESKNQDIIKYNFSGGIRIDMPGGGQIRIPFSATDEIPVPKVPNIKVEGLKIEQINLFSAAMKLGIKVNNPNSFKINLKKYNYIFELNNNQIGSGSSDSGFSIEPKSQQLIEFPFNVSFANAGIALYKILTSDSSPDYLFKIEGEAGTGLDSS
jgi:LEA14-like dessication related protein